MLQLSVQLATANNWQVIANAGGGGYLPPLFLSIVK